MGDARQAWDRAGESFERLGAQLREHYTRAGGEGGSTGTGAREMDDALRRLAETVETAVKAVGEAVRDREVQEAAKNAGRALGDALAATIGRRPGA